MFDYDDYNMCEDHCKQCDDKAERLECAQEWLQQVVNVLYGVQPYNRQKLEYALDELCHYLNVKLVSADLVVDEKPIAYISKRPAVQSLPMFMVQSVAKTELLRQTPSV